MLKKALKIEIDEELITKTADTLKLSFIKGIQENGMPSFKNIKRAFKRQKISEDHYVITEICNYPDGGKSAQRLHTCKTENGWRVLSPEDKKPAK